MKTILDLHNIYYSYHTSHGETRALSNLSFSLAPGEFAAVVGPSGCGKSTLLSLICGLMKPQTGEILLNGEPVLGNSPQIGYMLQHDHLFEWRTIYRNILLGPEISHTLNKEIREKAKSMLTHLLSTQDLPSFPVECGSVQHSSAPCSPNRNFFF